ncbi:hypothetical protein F9230_03420 [Acinetobacter johnsonii]|uniref:hypothetical protein n=1 Tax=Acinetobacter johnsonii TaxID=40214 RepID=UPI001F1ACE0B|nr:hypothetical protein [Acinetobacter johnsonii]UJA03485.1 hypothetical protein F9230_03420 [Acinetobacter johnsonii]
MDNTGKLLQEDDLSTLSDVKSRELLGIYTEINEKIKSYLKKIETNLFHEIRDLSESENFINVKRFNEREFNHHLLLIAINFEILKIEDFSKSLLDYYNDFKNKVMLIDEVSHFGLLSIQNYIEEFKNNMNVIKHTGVAMRNANNLYKNELNPKLKEVEEKIKDLESVRLALEMRSTNQIYSNLADKYEAESKNYFKYFYICLGVSAALTFFSIAYYANENSINWITFVSVKLLILALAITLCSIFLRRASHAKKLQDQAYQTHVEIDAFPIHVRSLKEEDKQELIKELALKYFGKELDQTQNDKIGDLMKDQLTAGTELIKASAELVKAKGGYTTPP